MYSKFKTFSVTLDMVGAIIPLPSSDETLGILDNIVLSYGTLVSFFAHPTPSELRGPLERVFIRQATLKLCDMGTTAAVDTMKRFGTADKEVTKRWSASVSGIAAIPIFYLEQASNVLDLIERDEG
ncbi:hypothetical protein BDW59DRAFT_166625 [Aspergillus cavernicola]|uniref:Uncharacterized protein n=1 Tax=Aspergillus cavernicola TaxID=176166 RepID=A0ABR4HJZ3_9EURO